MDTKIQELFKFGQNIFDDKTMRERLPENTYKSLRKTIDEKLELEEGLADIVAKAMKDWAMEKHATHYCHWFIPMTGATAEKHDAFLSLDKNGKVIYDLSGKNLIKGEPDASSFPSGGLRATFEARGYTSWDYSSPAFIRDGSLYIPTAFCSYTGDALDKRIPLLRSMEAISNAASKVMNLINMDVKYVNTLVGAEQEYFLIDKEMYRKRPDLIYTGRTLLGKMPPKGQELDDHYFGSIKSRVAAFMKDLDAALWELGVTAKTKHNEAAPSQHEIVPLYSVVNIATDANHLTMEVMRKVAGKHNFVCLLHEKPFEGVNGSGKHNNWSLWTDTGINLLRPGKNPKDNLPFMLTLSAVIRAVNLHGDLLRMSIAGAGNDHRLGSHEAPPGIVSMYLGDELTYILDEITTGSTRPNNKRTIKSANMLASFTLDNSDRNRTSPFAFTGNKFEFRMVGSSASIAGANTTLNAIVTDSFEYIYSRLKDEKNPSEFALTLIKEIILENQRIIFNGDNYTQEWVKEARKRGIPNLKDTIEAVGTLKNEDNICLFVNTGVYTAAELRSRYEILLENYIRTVNIESNTLVEIVNSLVIPAVNGVIGKLAESYKNLTDSNFKAEYMKKQLLMLTDNTEKLYNCINKLEEATAEALSISDTLDRAKAYRDSVLINMGNVRFYADELEKIVGKEDWPMPSYGDLLFYV